MLFNSEVDFGNLVKMTNGGVVVASFPQILEMLKKRYKEVYGSDINLDMTTADGIWLHDISLLINNILQTMQMLYGNLDVNSATGVYLESLCKLANVTRKPATSSYAEVTITNIGNAPVDLYGVSCIDREGRIWSTTQTITGLNPNASITIKVTCQVLGEVKAVAGSIYQVVDTDSNVLLSVYQSVDAVEGSEEESDADLRARKNQANSPIGMTVLESLQGALLQQPGVRDALIINNWSEETWGKDEVSPGVYEYDYKGYDNTEISPHNIYVVLRTLDLSSELKKNIADVIYNKLTPGIMTQEPDASVLAGTIQQETYYPSIYGETYEGYNVAISWKRAIPVHPAISITLTPKAHYTDNEREQIGKELVEYLNGLPLNTDLVIDELKLKIMELDPLFKGLYTYTVGTITIGGNNTDYTNTLTYYNYNTIDLSAPNKIIISYNA